MYWTYESPLTMMLMIGAIAIAGVAQLIVSSAYGKYKKIKAKQGLSGFEVARKILDKNGLSEVHIVETNGALSDHYDPRRKVVRLSGDIFHGTSIASVAVAAHEVGHAIQDKVKYLPMRIRSAIVPMVNVGSILGYVAILIGIIFKYPSIAWIGIILECGILAFQLVTLPVELNASSRAKKELHALNILDTSENKKASSMLWAAAMTYIASILAALLQLLRLIIIVGDQRR